MKLLHDHVFLIISFNFCKCTKSMAKTIIIDYSVLGLVYTVHVSVSHNHEHNTYFTTAVINTIL